MLRPRGGLFCAATSAGASKGGRVCVRRRQAAARRTWAGDWRRLAPPSAFAASAFSCLLILLAVSRVAGFLGSRRRCRLRLLGFYSGCLIQQVLDDACRCRCNARERWPDTTHTFWGCSRSPAGSSLSAFSRAGRRSGRMPIVLSCRAPTKYPGCMVEPQADVFGVPRHLPFEVAFHGKGVWQPPWERALRRAGGWPSI